MNILVVCQYYDPEPFRVCDICEGLVQRGHQVTAVTGMPNYPEGVLYAGYESGESRDEIRNGVRVHRCSLIPRKQGDFYRFLNYYSFVFSARKYLKTVNEDFDVVFVNQLSPVMMAEPAIYWARKHGKKCVLYCLDLWPESLQAGGIRHRSLTYHLFLHVSRKIYREVDKIAVTSHGFLDYFRQTLKMDTSDFVYLPQSAEELFSHIETPEADKEGVDFLFAGNIGAMQSVETIVEAARLLQGEKHIRIHIAGGGISLDHCRKLGEGLSNLRFYGRRPLEEMPGFYAMADVMLITLKKEPVISMTLPGKIQSYMAAGKPIVGAIDGETPWMLREADCGACVPAEDAEALADLIRSVAEDGKKRRHWGENARNYYRAHFRKDIFLDRLEKLLGDACGQGV